MDNPQFVIDSDGYIRSKSSGRIIGRIDRLCLYLYDRTMKIEIPFPLIEWVKYLEKRGIPPPKTE